MRLIKNFSLDFVPAGLLAGIKMSQAPDAFVFDHKKIIDQEEKRMENPVA